MKKSVPSMPPDHDTGRADQGGHGCAAELHARAARANARGSVELYLRFSRTMRVTRSAVADAEVRSGRDEGLALRVVRGRGEAPMFAAASGCDEAALDWAVSNLGLGETERTAQSHPWSDKPPLPAEDLDDIDTLPDEEAMRSWLDSAWSSLGAVCTPFDAWVESASTEELWLTGAWVARRRRCRAWALARVGGRGGSRPVMVAARDWGRLGAEGWAEIMRDRLRGAVEGQTGRRVVFGVEASGALVWALARVVHAHPAHRGRSVGPGWVVHAEPLAPDGLFGAHFDDAGFPVVGGVLADGRKIVGTAAGPGWFRRASFRDRPESAPAHIRVPPGDNDSGDAALHVGDLAIHDGGDGEWILDLCHASMGPERRTHLRISPEELLRRCAGRVGAAFHSHHGVVAPRLVFEDLGVRADRDATAPRR